MVDSRPDYAQKAGQRNPVCRVIENTQKVKDIRHFGRSVKVFFVFHKEWDVAFAKGIDPLIHPANRRPERNTVVANFASALQLLEGFPEGVVLYLFHPDVVQLQQIDPIRFQSSKGRIGRAHNRVRRKILRDFALPASARFAVSDKVIADLGRDRDLVAIFRERLGDVFLAQTIAISIRCIEKRDTQIERLAHEGEGLAFGVVSPPPSGNRPHP